MDSELTIWEDFVSGSLTNYSYKDPISTYSHEHRYWGWDLNVALEDWGNTIPVSVPDCKVSRIVRTPGVPTSCPFGHHSSWLTPRGREAQAAEIKWIVRRVQVPRWLRRALTIPEATRGKFQGGQEMTALPGGGVAVPAPPTRAASWER